MYNIEYYGLCMFLLLFYVKIWLKSIQQSQNYLISVPKWKHGIRYKNYYKYLLHRLYLDTWTFSETIVIAYLYNNIIIIARTEQEVCKINKKKKNVYNILVTYFTCTFFAIDMYRLLTFFLFFRYRNCVSYSYFVVCII